MNKSFLSLVLSLFLLLSCNDDDDVTQENSNGFLVNSEFAKINNAYYTSDLSTERNDDFIIIVTDGEIISYSSDSNEFQFSDATTNAVIFNGVQNPNTPTAINFAPSGSYIFNSNNETIGYTLFKFNCGTFNGNLEMCEYSQTIEESSNSNTAIVDIIRDDQTAIYNISYDFELPNSVSISGQYIGILERLYN